MRTRSALAVLVAVVCLVGVAGLSYAVARPAGTPKAYVPIPGARQQPVRPTPDTTAGIDAILQQDFSIEVTPSTAPSAVSEAEALAIAKRSGYAKQAESVTVRHVVYTNRNMARLSTAQLADMGVKEAPVGLDAWLITYHKVPLHAHGPRGSNHSPIGDFVSAMSARTGEIIESSAFSPVR